jgi:hypothetical protein
MTKRLPHLVPPVVEDLRLTIPAREAVEGENRVIVQDTPDGPRYDVQLVRPPAGLEVVSIIGTGEIGVRLEGEPEYPGEHEAAWWHRGAWVGCPECGHALLWCEAGFVPGWRVCLAGHAVQLSGDGRSAERQPAHDAATLRATKRP